MLLPTGSARTAPTLSGQGEARWSELPTGLLRGDAIVAVMQAADFRRRHDAAGRGRLDWSGHRAVLREREMRTRAHLVRDVAREHLTQAEFVHHDHGSRHSRRIEPMTRSTWAFCQGERGAVRTTSMCISAIVVSAAAKAIS